MRLGGPAVCHPQMIALDVFGPYRRLRSITGTPLYGGFGTRPVVSTRLTYEAMYGNTSDGPYSDRTKAPGAHARWRFGEVETEYSQNNF